MVVKVRPLLDGSESPSSVVYLRQDGSESPSFVVYLRQDGSESVVFFFAFLRKQTTLKWYPPLV